MSCLSESTALATRLNQSSETQNYGSKLPRYKVSSSVGFAATCLSHWIVE